MASADNCESSGRPADLILILVGSNSLSDGDWELDEVSTVGNPAHMVQIGLDGHVPIGEAQRRVALQ
jgi:hypothetical protein